MIFTPVFSICTASRSHSAWMSSVYFQLSLIYSFEKGNQMIPAFSYGIFWNKI